MFTASPPLGLATHLLTDLQLKALEAPQRGQKLHWDEATPAFGVRISQGGAKSFVLVYQKRFITIGRYPTISVAQARAEAKRLLAEFTLGRIRPQSITYKEAVELFLADKAQGRRPSTVYSYKLKLGRLKFHCQLSDITPSEAARRLERIKAPSERSHVLVAAKVFFGWCLKRRYISENPFFGLTKPAQKPRERVLTDAELKALWAIAPPLIKILILTGQRRSEIAALRRSYIQEDLCVLPSSLTKNGTEHTFPLSRTCLSIFTTLPAWGQTGYLFPSHPSKSLQKPFGAWAELKRMLDRASGVSGWQLHDIRRTFATNMARLGTPMHITEKLLNHISGSFGGIVSVYQRHSFIKEMREAVQRHEDWLLSIVG